MSLHVFTEASVCHGDNEALKRREIKEERQQTGACSWECSVLVRALVSCLQTILQSTCSSDVFCQGLEYRGVGGGGELVLPGEL